MRTSQRVVIVLAVGISGIALALSLIGRSRAWLHDSGGAHIWYHLGLFAVLGALAMLASRRAALQTACLAVLVVMAAVMEFGEAVRFHNVMEWNDVQSDALGIGLGACVAWWVAYSRRQRP